mgnify:CR=1 FL=1
MDSLTFLADSPLSGAAPSQHLDSFLRLAPQDRYVFGTGLLARRLADALDAGAFLDDFRAGETVDGRPVLSPEAAAGRIVANGVAGVSPFIASDRIEGVGATPIDYLRFTGAGLVPFPVIGQGFIADFRTHTATYRAIFERLADSVSQETYAAIINTRYHHDTEFMRGFSDRQEEQYFEPFLGLNPQGEVFADVGSFDGSTSRAFTQRFPGYQKIHVVEPSGELMGAVRRNLADLRDVQFHEVGAGAAQETVALAADGSASRVVQGGGERVHLSPLDMTLEPAPSFMKMDIEGHEIPALLGARRIVTQRRPVLAIACYHRPDDLRTIVEVVDDMRSDYRLYLRHYTQGLTESVYFFVPS